MHDGANELALAPRLMSKGEIVLQFMTNTALVVAAGMTLTSCAATSFQSTWRNPGRWRSKTSLGRAIRQINERIVSRGAALVCESGS